MLDHCKKICLLVLRRLRALSTLSTWPHSKVKRKKLKHRKPERLQTRDWRVNRRRRTYSQKLLKRAINKLRFGKAMSWPRSREWTAPGRVDLHRRRGRAIPTGPAAHKGRIKPAAGLLLIGHKMCSTDVNRTGSDDLRGTMAAVEHWHLERAGIVTRHCSPHASPGHFGRTRASDHRAMPQPTDRPTDRQDRVNGSALIIDRRRTAQSLAHPWKAVINRTTHADCAPTIHVDLFAALEFPVLKNSI